MCAFAPGASAAAAAEAPPFGATGPVESITETSARLNGKIYPEGSDITECRFEYGRTGTYGSQASCATLPPATEAAAGVDASITNLSPGTTYHVRLVARNANGIGVTPDSTFTTSGGCPGADAAGCGPVDPGGGDGGPQPAAPSPPPNGPSSPPAESGCPTLKLIGVRGSGEPQGLGRPVGAFARALAGELGMQPDDGNFGINRLFYPAKPVDVPKHTGNDFGPIDLERAWTKRMFGTPYDHSVEDGVRSLVDALRLDPCGAETRYVLAGYSQGADVIGDALENHKIGWYRSRIVATVLFGDPMFDARLRDARFYGSTRKRGLLTKLGSRRQDSFEGYHVLSFCRRTDPFCQSNISALLHGRTAGHEHYQDQEAKQAATLVAAAWRR